MGIIIVEDDISIIKILEKIIYDRGLGEVVDYAIDGNEGVEKINKYNPDIVLVDLLMPEKDGLSLVREVTKYNNKVHFIMISQVMSKDMIGKAYEYGVEYYINKPINAVEVENVIKKVQEKIKLNKTLEKIKYIFAENISVDSPKVENVLEAENESMENYEEKIRNVMSKIGIMGEVGSEDIVKIVSFLIKSKKTMNEYSIKDLCSKFTDNPKSMEQRIRRTATVGMVNLANIGIEDYMNDVFVDYSNGIYNFEQIKKEMDFIRGKSSERGKVSLKKFIQGMAFYCEK
ncbi:response regulator [Clostridium sp. KNHs214]|uniref:response regulator n=1 Tax=Clostridium sp. KNHs214 TaxID=1540257 RepID=UPI000554B082|nr:response regulator [Clostridium sp. KNHs214]